MEYTHRENGHRMIFADEKDYLRCKLLHLEEFVHDASGDISFDFFIRRELYRGFERRGRMEVRVESEGYQREIVTISIFPDTDDEGHSTETQRRAVEMGNRQRMRREVNEQDYRALMDYHHHPLRPNLPNSSAVEAMIAMREAGAIPLTHASSVPDSRVYDEQEFAREFQAEFTGDVSEPTPSIAIMAEMEQIEYQEYMRQSRRQEVDSVDEVETEAVKEEIVVKKLNKDKSIFDIIDID